MSCSYEGGGRHLGKFCPHMTEQDVGRSEALRTWSCHSGRCVLREPPRSAQRTQVERGEPLKCLIQGGEWKRGGEMERAEKDVIISISSSVLVWGESQKTDDLHFLWDSTEASLDSEEREKRTRERVWSVGKHRKWKIERVEKERNRQASSLTRQT